MTGVVGAGVGIGVAIGAAGLGVAAVGAVTVLPCYGIKKLYKHLKSKNRMEDIVIQSPTSLSIPTTDQPLPLHPPRVLRSKLRRIPRQRNIASNQSALDLPIRSHFSSDHLNLQDQFELRTNISNTLSLGILFVDDLLTDIDTTDLQHSFPTPSSV
jgi:hypothetical protein